MRDMRHLVLLITLLSAWTTTSHAQTKVEIFYETLSDAGRKFFVEQFKLVADNLIDDIELNIYPYGNTKLDGTTYTCPFGDTQCEANKIHACLINAELTPATPFMAKDNLMKSYVQGKKQKAITDPINEKSVASFVNCFFKNRFALDNVEELGERCLPAGGEADWAEIHSCVTEPETSSLTDELAAVTNQVATEIAADGLVVRIGGNVNAAAKTNLLAAVCTAIGKTNEVCVDTTAQAKVKLAVYYEAFNRDASNYLVKQLGTYYHVLEDFVDIDLVPYGNALFDSVAGTYNCTQDTKCISNKFQALVVDKYIGKPLNGDPISGENRAINFISCLSTSTLADTYQALETCSNLKLEADDYRLFIDFIRFDDPTVKTVFEAMRTKTAAVATGGVLPRIPLVTLNGQIDYNAFDDLVQEACAQYKGYKTDIKICTKVKMTVLYEPLNHKSRTLFLEQLNPVFSSLYNLLDFQMNPAGRAILQPGAGFVCSAGGDQCEAMKLQACALEYWNDGNNYTDPIRQEVFEFIVCVTKNKKLLNVMDAAELCSEQYLEFDAWFNIHGCYIDGIGNGLVDEYIQEAQSTIIDIGHHNIPILLVDGKEVTDLTNLKKLVCDFFDQYHAPDYCFADAVPKVKIQVYYEGMNELSKYFFTSQFQPWYMYVEEMASIELFPAGNVIESTNDGTCDSYETTSVCLANKIQAVVIDRYSKHDDDGDFIDGTLRTAEFLGCYFNHPNFKDNAYNAGEYCSEQALAADEWFQLVTAVKGAEGQTIYKGVLDATAKFKTDNSLPSFDPLPWVTLDNNKHSKRAADDLLQTVCAQYTGDNKPLECTPVQVQIYYSAINPQSRRFFLDQVEPTFRNLRERFHLDLIPYGLANEESTIDEECSTKVKTCQANTVQACAVKLLFEDGVIDNSLQWDGKNQTLSYVNCMFKNIKNMDIMALAEECGNKNIILAEEIMQCAREQEGKDYLTEMRQRTLGQFEQMEHSPWIVINGHRSALAQSDLKQAICDAMVGDKPNYCYEPTPSKVKVEFHYSALDNNAQSYVMNELYPHYRLLEEIIDLEVVPFGLTEVRDQGNGNYTLICPNGVKECQANRIHACIYNMYYHADDDPISDIQDETEYDGKVQVIEFINCYFTSGDYPSKPEAAALECAEAIFGDIFSKVKMCEETSLSTQLLLEFQEKKVKTLLPHLTYLPWITQNGKHSYSVEHHIQRSVCDAYTGKQKPQDCHQIYDADDKPWVWIHYELSDYGSKNFFTSVLDAPTSSGIANIHLVPFGRSTYDATTKKCVNDDGCLKYKEHACIIKHYYELYPVNVLQTISCTFGDLMNDTIVVNECVNQNLESVVPDPWKPIETCVLEEGAALLTEYANIAQSLNPKISHVPWILINEEHNIEAEERFADEICYVYYPSDKPALCKPALIPVAVYYETVNEDVDSFFINQLPQYTEYLDEIGDFTFIPYGTTKNNGGQFTCAQGTAQCEANTVHACILNRFYNRSSVNPESEYERNRIRVAGFLECASARVAIGETDPVLIAEECLDINFEGDLWRDIHFCSHGPEGALLNAEMARKTAALSPALTSAPYITINSVKNTNAETNLFQALCNSYPLVRAPLCATLQSMAVKVGIFFSANAAAQKYFREQVLQFYKEIVPAGRVGTSEAKLHAAIAPDLIAWGETTYDATNTEKPFTCPGGDNECFINRLFACAEHFHGKEAKYNLHKMEFALCFFSQDNALTEPEKAGNICANRVWIPDPYVQLETCAKSTDQDSYDIFLAAKLKTENNYPHLTSFPAVTVNHERDPTAESDLLTAVCINYKGYDAPVECAGITAPPTTPGTGPTQPVTTPDPNQTTATPGTGPTQPVTTPDPNQPTTTPGTGPTQPVTTPDPNLPTTTLPPGGSGTTPTISIFVLLVSFFICRLIH